MIFEVDHEYPTSGVPFVLGGDECGSEFPLASSARGVSVRVQRYQRLGVRKTIRNSTRDARKVGDFRLVEPNAQPLCAEGPDQRLHPCSVGAGVAHKHVVGGRHIDPVECPHFHRGGKESRRIGFRKLWPLLVLL